MAAELPLRDDGEGGADCSGRAHDGTGSAASTGGERQLSSSLWRRGLAQWRQVRRHERALGDEFRRENLRRLRFMAVVVVPLNLLHLLIFGQARPAPGSLEASWTQGVFIVHLAMAVTLTLLGLAAHRLISRGRARWAERAVMLAALVGSLAFAGALGVVDQWVTPAITPVLIGSMAVSLVFLIRPLPAVLLYGAAGAAIVWSLGLTQANAAMLLSNRVNALSGLLMGAALSILLWHKSGANALLRRELQASNRQLQQQQAELQRLVVQDPLTGVINRREFERVFRLELVRAQRLGSTTALIAIDLDHFKAINDRHGHPAGDQVLQQVAQQLATLLRRYDVLARYGGEEFMVLLPQTDQPAALAVAEKLRAAVQALVLRIDALPPGVAPPQLTASLGVASSSATLTQFEQFYTRADQALYEAKRLGRNRVVSSDVSLGNAT